MYSYRSKSLTFLCGRVVCKLILACLYMRKLSVDEKKLLGFTESVISGSLLNTLQIFIIAQSHCSFLSPVVSNIVPSVNFNWRLFLWINSKYVRIKGQFRQYLGIYRWHFFFRCSWSDSTQLERQLSSNTCWSLTSQVFELDRNPQRIALSLLCTTKLTE